MSAILSRQIKAAGQARTGGHPAYRPDIDGLRTVAVAGVILFHYRVAPFTGGFVGVDVFFVISGYLITGIVAGESRRGTFTLAGFAERRLRRILPALLVVLFASELACTRLLPNDLKAIGLGFVSAATFTANLFFAAQAEDYFSAGSLAVQPALHIWSLAVEAQFYLAFAVLWIVARGRPGARGAAMAVFGLASFGLSLWFVAQRPELAFYQMPLRFWEFMIGGALAGSDRPIPKVGRGASAGMTIGGIALIVLGFVHFSPLTLFPGAAALLPCGGAALLIAGGRWPTFASRTIGAWPLAAAGRLSYGLYLWHWPVLVVATYGRAAAPDWAARSVLFGITVLAAGLSWLLIERPIIERRILARRMPFFLACAAGILVVAGLGVVINLAGQGLVPLTRLPADVLKRADGQFDGGNYQCRVGDQVDEDCRFGSPDVTPSVVLWGNSFARMWAPGLDEAARRHGAGGVELLINRCPPLLGMAFPTLRGCEAFNREAFDYIDAHPALKTVVLGGNWAAWSADLPRLSETVTALTRRGRRVVVLRAPPAVPYAPPRTLALALLRGEAPPPLVATAAAKANLAAMNAGLDIVQAKTGFVSIDPLSSLCGTEGCRVQQGGTPLYYDEDHITGFAARQLSSLFDPVFAPQPKP